jgi:selenocysteine-specific elongation factor
VVVQAFLREADVRGLTVESVVRRAGLDPAASRAVLDALAGNDDARSIGDRTFATSAVADVRAHMLRGLAAFHGQHPAERGMPRETLRERTAARAPVTLFDTVMADLVREGLVRAGERIALASHQIEVSTADERLANDIEVRLRAAGLSPPDPAVIATDLRVPAATVHRLLQSLVRQGRVVKTGDLLFHRDALEALRSAVAALRTGHALAARVTLDVAAFKAQHGLTRKHAIPLLEWLDRERVTRRVGDVRIVL